MKTLDALTRIVRLPARRKRQSPAGVVFTMTAALLLVVALCPAKISFLEDVVVRLAASAAGRAAPAQEIAIIAVDERSLREVGPWPWPRATVAQLVERLRQAGAGLILIDDRTATDSGLSDLRLPSSREGGADFAIGYTFYRTLGEIPDSPPDDERALQEAENALAFPSTPADDAPLPSAAGVKLNAFGRADRPYLREGFGTLFPDADGVVRRQPLAVRFRHRVYPALALAAAAQWRGYTPILAQDPQGQPAGTLIGEERIVTGTDGQLPIAFRGPAGTFPRFPAAEILAGRIAREQLDSRLVLIGLAAPDMHAAHRTPVGTMPDIEIAASVLDNLLLNRGLQSLVRPGIIAAIVLVLGLLFAFLVPRLATRRIVLATAAFSVLAIAAGVVLMRNFGTQIPAMHAIAAAILLAGTLLLWSLVRIELPRRAMRRQWHGRLAADAIDAAIGDSSLLFGPGRAMAVTALSVDIKGFAALVEALAPTRLAEFLKTYRRIVAEAVTEHGGFIESWAGDECRAVFGAPIKTSAHALAAVRAAALMRRRIVAAREAFERDFGVERCRLGLGIHSGTGSAGDLGAGGTIGFGVCGAAVEAACRLRTMNRLYRTATLVGDSVRAAAEGAFAFRPLDPVLIPGERGGVPIHELVGETGTIMPQLAGYLAARDAYMHGDFASAARLFGDVLREFPHDGPSQLLLRRATHLADNPPEEKWTGVWGRS